MEAESRPLPPFDGLAVLFWRALLGAVGGMLALALTLGIKLLLLDAFPESRWLSTAIEAGVPPDTTAKDP